MPVKNGSLSEEALGRHNTDGDRPDLALAAVVTLLLVLDVLVPLPVDAVPDDVDAPPLVLPAVVVPLAAGMAAVPVVTTAPMPVVLVVWLWGTELIAVVPVVIAPGPLTVPAVAARPTDPPPPVEPPLGEPLPAVPLVVVVVPAFAGGGVGLVLLSVPAGVVAAPRGAVAPGVVPVLSVGSFTAPVPTWPAPAVPGVGPPTVAPVVPVVLPTACARAGVTPASDTIATSASIAFMPPKRAACAPVRGWPR